MTTPEPSLRHLMRMLDDTGLFEHAIGALPRRSHGYCTDDAGRALAVAVRSGDDADALLLSERCLAFLAHAHEGDGRFHIRMGFDRRWTADPASDDASGRAIFGIGVAAAAAPWAHVRREARRLFREVAAFRSTYPRATASAAIGAAELLRIEPGDTAARSLVEDALACLPRPSIDEAWPWPEERLAYANAVLTEALIAAGDAVDDKAAVDDGLRLLGWLVQTERLGDHFSFTPTGGRGPDDPDRGSTSSRSRLAPSPTPVPARATSRVTRSGSNRSCSRRNGSRAATTSASPCSIQAQAAGSTVCTPTG